MPDTYQIQKLNPKKQIVIANQINQSRFRMTRAEQKLILYCIGMVDNKEGKIRRTFEMDIKDFVDFLEIKGNDYYKRMMEITDDFVSRVFEIKQPNGEIHKIPALSIIKYKKGSVEMKINDQLVPYLLNLKSHFTKYSLQEVLKFKSGFSMRLYQLLAQYQYKKEVEYSLEHLRFCLNVADGKFKRFFDFRRYVLEVSKKEITEKSSLRFEYQTVKQGRKVVAVRFTITQPIKPDLTLPHPNADAQIALNRTETALREALDLSDDRIHQLTQKHSSEALKNALDVVAVYSKEKLTKKADKPLNLFYDVLRNPDKYDLTQHVEDMRQEKRKQEEAKKLEQERLRQEAEQEEKQQAQQSLKDQAIDQFIELNPEEYEEVLEQVLEELKGTNKFLYGQNLKLATVKQIPLTAALTVGAFTKNLPRQKIWNDILKDNVVM